MEPTNQFISKSRDILSKIESQQAQLKQAAEWCAASILSSRVTHVFGSGHSRIMVEEMWPRYGSFPGFNPIVELSLTFHNLVVGANGQRQAMFLENVSGFAARILRNFDLSDKDTAIVISSSGCNTVPIEMGEQFQRHNIKVIALVSLDHLKQSKSKRVDGKKLNDFADLTLDTGAPPGDAMVNIEGMDTPVAPGSTVGGAMIINCLKSEIAQILVNNGKIPKVLSGPAIVGEQRARELFESAYDEHAHNMARLYENVGVKPIED